MRKVCSKDFCDKLAQGRGLCNTHLKAAVYAEKNVDKRRVVVDYWPQVVQALGIEGANYRKVKF